MNKMAIRTAIFIMFVLFLAACEGMAESGTVTEKRHEDSYQEMYFICGSYSSQGTCTVQVPIFETVPECWSIIFENEEDYGSACVSKEEYSMINVGDHFPKN